tara:strand:+ start:8481 stop:8711 length:231 start_codon:yes stop_codon:yes gene_type:complete
MGLKIEVDYQMADLIMVHQLCDTRDGLLRDRGNNNHVFVWGDQEADDLEIQKHIDAIDLLLQWYSTPEQLKDIYGA